MSNEGKILSMLENLTSKVDSIEQNQNQMRNDIKELKQGQAKLEQEIQSVKDEVQSVKDVTLRMEITHGDMLRGLRDGYIVNYEIIERFDPRVTKVERAIERLDFDMSFLKSEVAKHY